MVIWIETAAPTRSEHAATMASYAAECEQHASDLGIRGPLTLTSDGRLHPDILEAYAEHGCYVFEGVVDTDEVAALRSAVHDIIERAPAAPRSDVDRHGRPAIGRDHTIEPFVLTRPLSDPWGGTTKLAGRHPTQMTQPTAEGNAPSHTVHLIFGMCMLMPEALRLYGHPALLAAAASINGDDFVPYNDAIFVKLPGLGASVGWHQDGATHWDAPDWHPDIHGFNFQVQLHDTTAANSLWVVPGSHRHGKADIVGMVADNDGSDMLPDAVPLVCRAGDVTIANRQLVHGSYANSSPDPRVSITFGFHPRASVLGVAGKLRMTATGSPDPVYTDERIRKRAEVIALAIHARQQHHPDETPFRYAPFAGLEDDHRYDPATIETILRDYNTHDLAI